MAQSFSGQSARTVCERSWVRVSVGPCAFSSPVVFGGSVWVRARTASSKRDRLVSSGMVQSKIMAGGNCHRSTVRWSECSYDMREVLGQDEIR